MGVGVGLGLGGGGGLGVGGAGGGVGVWVSVPNRARAAILSSCLALKSKGHTFRPYGSWVGWHPALGGLALHCFISECPVRTPASRSYLHCNLRAPVLQILRSYS